MALKYFDSVESFTSMSMSMNIYRYGNIAYETNIHYDI